MPGGGVSISDSHSDKELLIPDTDSEDQSLRSGSKQPASANKPHIRAVTPKDSPSIFSIASSVSGKNRPGQTGKADSGKAASGKSKVGGKLQRQVTKPLLFNEVSSSWKDDDDTPLLQNEGKATSKPNNAQSKKASQPVFKNTPSPGATSSNNKTSPSKRNANASSNMDGQEASDANDSQDSVIVKSSSENDNNPPPSNAGKPQSPKQGDGNALKDRKPDNSVIIRKMRKKITQTQGAFVSADFVKEQKAKAEAAKAKLTPKTPREIEELVGKYSMQTARLMTGEDTEETAEKVYQAVAKICTDQRLDDKQKLECLFGDTGKTKANYKDLVNIFFDAWIIEKYQESHAVKQPARNSSEAAKKNGDKEERDPLLSQDDENDTDNAGKKKSPEQGQVDVPKNLDSIKDQWKILTEFKRTLNWWERRKIDNVKVPKKFEYKYHSVRVQLQKEKMIRKMQEKLTLEERDFIKKQTKIFHDQVVNAGLPALHIAIKNESIFLVQAYLRAVLTFAPFEIKKQAIQATQYQGLQAFYYVMTHSTTEMIKVFMQTILESEFLFYQDKDDILQARRPDRLKNGTYGISAFYIAMSSGDMARADAFMSTLLMWDCNCNVKEHTNIKFNLLEAQKSFWVGDSAKLAAKLNGHKELVQRFDKYVNNSLMPYDYMDALYFTDKSNFLPKEVKEEPPPISEEACRKIEDLARELAKLTGKKLPGEEDLPERGRTRKEGYLDVPIFRTERDEILLWERQRTFLEIDGKPIPEELQRRSEKDMARLPIENLNLAGSYATFSNYPKPKQGLPRRTDGDRLMGGFPKLSEAALQNSYMEKQKNNTLPPRSTSYRLADKETMFTPPKSLRKSPESKNLSPVDSSPASRKQRAQPAPLGSGTPTKLASTEGNETGQQLGVGRIPVESKNRQKSRSKVRSKGDTSVTSVPV